MGKVNASTVLSYAIGQTGYQEGRNNYNKFAPVVGHGNNQPWCATFTTWAFQVAGQTIPSGAKTAACYYNNVAWKNAGRFSYYPAVGAVFFLGSSGQDHTGLVVRYDSTYIYTIEGNTGASMGYDSEFVAQHKRTRSSVYGYGYPDYAHAIVSADPKWGGSNSGGSTPTPTTPPSSTLPRPDSSSPSAKGLQQDLKNAGYLDKSIALADNYGPATQAAVRAFHKANPAYGTASDSAIGPMGWAHLKTEAKGTSTPTPPPVTPPAAEKPWVWWPNLKYGKENNSILIMQKALKSEVGLNYSSGPGIYGPATKAAVKKLQERLYGKGPDSDGFVGLSTARWLAAKYKFDVRGV